MKLSRPSFPEAGRNEVDTDQFERDLQLMISNMSFASQKIVRWEDSSTIPLLQKQETVTHYWYLSPRDEKGSKLRMPYFVSSHLYIDTDWMMPCTFFKTFGALVKTPCIRPWVSLLVHLS